MNSEIEGAQAVTQPQYYPRAPGARGPLKRIRTPEEIEARRKKQNEQTLRRYHELTTEQKERFLELTRPRVREHAAKSLGYASHDARLSAAAARREQRLHLAQVVVDAKRGGCVVCGEGVFECLDFHHIDPKTKSFSIGMSGRVMGGLKHVECEINKCVVLCANCHRKFHAGLITLPERCALPQPRIRHLAADRRHQQSSLVPRYNWQTRIVPTNTPSTLASTTFNQFEWILKCLPTTAPGLTHAEIAMLTGRCEGYIRKTGVRITTLDGVVRSGRGVPNDLYRYWLVNKRLQINAGETLNRQTHEQTATDQGVLQGQLCR